MQQTKPGQLWGIVLAAGEGTRVRPFLQQLCGGRGIKQFCAVIGRRSLLQHTLARIERLIPHERILVVVGRQHREEVEQQLVDGPPATIIYQPANRGTLPGLLLPLTYVAHRDLAATVVVFPSDHFILDEARFMHAVERAVVETHRFPQELLLLGITPDKVEEGYGWIEAERAEQGRESRTVQRFWEKPSLAHARRLLTGGALWNTMVFAVQAPTLWAMIRQTAPDLCHTFNTIRLMWSSVHTPLFIEHAYRTMPTLDFSAGVCEPLTSRLRVLPVSEVGWSDWGSEERILATLERIGKLDECLARLQQCRDSVDSALTHRTSIHLNEPILCRTTR